MDNAREALQFDIKPCPRCGKKFTVADVQKMEDDGGGYGILHDCPSGPGKGFYAYGWNVRMTIQNWNNYMKEWEPWANSQSSISDRRDLNGRTR